MPMQKIINDPSAFVDEMLDGVAKALDELAVQLKREQIAVVG